MEDEAGAEDSRAETRDRFLRTPLCIWSPTPEKPASGLSLQWGNMVPFKRKMNLFFELGFSNRKLDDF